MTGIVATAATVLAGGFLLPQIVRVVRSGDVAGVSPVWAGFGLVTNLAWVLYLGRNGIWGAVVAPGLAVLAYGTTLGVIRGRGGPWATASVAYAAVLAGLVAAAGMAGIALFLVMAPVVQLAPAVAAAYRSRCPSGLSPATWALSVAEAGLWGIYGWKVADPALVGYGLVTSGGSLLVLVRVALLPPRVRLASGRA
jgi:hypothetical protein